ncbi:MAG: hypothetical protein HKN41_04080 [Ilumatobacter sp.]|nr:hypothetical protein [Ilumatobacter sp.]
MPEFVEAEAYRRTIEPVLGRPMVSVDIRDDRLLRRDAADESFVRGALEGSTIDATRRIGKAVLFDVSSGHTALLSFGLRGWLMLDGRTARATGHDWRARTRRDAHVRLQIEFEGGQRLELEDQLRLATLELDPDESRFGIDVLDLDLDRLREILASSTTAVKTVLMDQRRIAGIGNLIADEMLYQGKVDPRRSASELSDDEVADLWQGVRRTRERVLERNGSHQGVQIQSGARERGSCCPRCEVQVERITVGGRTTYFCPSHQR